MGKLNVSLLFYFVIFGLKYEKKCIVFEFFKNDIVMLFSYLSN